jgi:hypothetical protein
VPTGAVPELFLQMWILRHQVVCCLPYEEVYMVLGHMPFHDLALVLPAYIPDQISPSLGHVSTQCRSSIFRYPHQMQMDLLRRTAPHAIQQDLSRFLEAICECMNSHAGFQVRKTTITATGSSQWPARRCSATTRLWPPRNPTDHLPAYLGPRGWVALRLDIGKVNWDEVADLVAASYRQIAPKRLAAL